ncbi:MAG TPA: GNAT family N-acetyltransferase, partial [Pseudoxanthomonas sp.]|nr:GNAT family N-acetyltransferase [Pseudoxanthomonas sp.]
MHELPQAWRTPPPLQGRHVALEPLRREHAEGLRAALAGDALSRAWCTSVPTAAGVDRWLDAAPESHAQGRALPFAVRDAGGEIMGSTRFYDLEP